MPCYSSHTYVKDRMRSDLACCGQTWKKVRRPDHNGGAAHPVAVVTGYDRRAESEFCHRVFPSRVPGAYDLRGGSGRMQTRIVSNAVHGVRLRDRADPAGSFRPSVRPRHWHEYSTAPHGDVEIRRFRVTHPYHPLFQQEFELVSYRQDWGEDRVWFQDKVGRLHSLPTSWTDAGAVDPFVALAAGRSLFRVADLVELARQIDGWKSERVGRTVKENMS
jgi:Family of unknown function (DUF5372)